MALLRPQPLPRTLTPAKRTKPVEIAETTVQLLTPLRLSRARSTAGPLGGLGQGLPDVAEREVGITVPSGVPLAWGISRARIWCFSAQFWRGFVLTANLRNTCCSFY